MIGYWVASIESLKITRLIALRCNFEHMRCKQPSIPYMIYCDEEMTRVEFSILRCTSGLLEKKRKHINSFQSLNDVIHWSPSTINVPAGEKNGNTSFPSNPGTMSSTGVLQL
ncbi:hypothetical protein TNCV_3326701 [Trichonephila clavipes]|nr:hypothetical protein TNCV_3326701 [Trichonephila clavipes]